MQSGDRAQVGTPWRLGHRPALDGLRGVAILLVICSHVAPSYTVAGPVGVTVFFVLSGFLITSLLLEERDQRGRVSMRVFYVRRARRLLPALAAFLVVVGAIQTVLGVPLRALVPVALYAGNWAAIAGAPMGLMKHTWSLSVEEQFYVVWPLVLLVAARWRGRRGVLIVASVGAVLSLLWRVALWSAGADPVHVRFGSDTSAAGLLAGCALAAWMHGRPAGGRNHPRSAAVVVVGLAVLSMNSSMTNYHVIAPTAAVVATSLVLWLVVQDGSMGAFGGAALRYVGRRSYGWFLWHAPVLILANRLDGSLGSRLIAVLIAVGIAELSWRFVERPWLDDSHLVTRSRRLAARTRRMRSPWCWSPRTMRTGRRELARGPGSASNLGAS